MAWFWTDDLARTLIEQGQDEPAEIAKWLRYPSAVSAPAGTDQEDLARRLAGLEAVDAAGVA